MVQQCYWGACEPKEEGTLSAGILSATTHLLLGPVASLSAPADPELGSLCVSPATPGPAS